MLSGLRHVNVVVGGPEVTLHVGASVKNNGFQFLDTVQYIVDKVCQVCSCFWVVLDFNA